MSLKKFTGIDIDILYFRNTYKERNLKLLHSIKFIHKIMLQEKIDWTSKNFIQKPHQMFSFTDQSTFLWKWIQLFVFLLLLIIFLLLQILKKAENFI